jgi:hypothetical protein
MFWLKWACGGALVEVQDKTGHRCLQLGRHTRGCYAQALRGSVHGRRDRLNIDHGSLIYRMHDSKQG